MWDGLLLAFVMPLGILAHELGHAVFALRLTDGPVRIVVGRHPGLVRLRLGRLSIGLHIEPARGTGWRGVCLHKPPRRPHDAILILAAGPVASLLWAIGCTVGLATMHGHAHIMASIALGIGVIEGVIAFVYNGAAAVSPSLMETRPRTDGAKIQRALRARRVLGNVERKVGRKLTPAELRHLVTTRQLPPDIARSQTSVAPPNTSA